MVLRRFKRQYPLTVCKGKKRCLFTIKEFFNYNPIPGIPKDLPFHHCIERINCLLFSLAYYSALSTCKSIGLYNKWRFYFLYPFHRVFKSIKRREKGCRNFIFLHK